jgi:hypothetical protein
MVEISKHGFVEEIFTTDEVKEMDVKVLSQQEYTEQK